VGPMLCFFGFSTIRYMLRPVGKPGRPYPCPLADPDNEPDEDYRPEIEVCRCGLPNVEGGGGSAGGGW